MDFKLFKYFKDFNKLSSTNLVVFVIFNFFVGLLDGIGLVMFIPLLYFAIKNDDTESLGNMEYIVNAFQYFNVPINLISVLVLMVLLFFVKGIMAYIRSLLSIKIQQSSARTIRFQLIDSLQRLSYEGFSKVDSGYIQNNMTTETNRYISAINIYLTCLQNISMMLIYVFMAIFADWKFAVLVVIGGLLTNIVFKYLNHYTTIYGQKLSNIGRNFQNYLIQNIINFKYLKATNYYEIYNEKLKREILLSENTQYKIGRISAVSDNLREPLIILIISIVMVVQLYFLNGNMIHMMAAILLFYRSLNHLTTFQGFWNKFLANIPAKFSIDSMMNSFSTFSEPKGHNKISRIGAIEIKDLNFSYGDRKILDSINITIKNKSSIALVGESGAGKTTLANIIGGLIEPKSGQVIIDGEQISQIDIKSFRNKVGYVTQEPVIFDDTLFNNITFWQEKNDENLAKFWKVIERASLKEFFEAHDNNEDLPLGSNGILISGGQKQRISIARELYKDIDLIILDEATSALDSETEKYIKEQIDNLSGKSTMVIIAHRLSTIKNTDIIFLMENGKIVEFGSYEELYQKSSKFQSMVKLQNLAYD